MSSKVSQSTPTIVKHSELNELIRVIVSVVNESFNKPTEAKKTKHKDDPRVIVIDLGNGNIEWTTQMGTLEGTFDQLQQSISGASGNNPFSYTPAIREDGFWMLKGSNGKAYMLLDIWSSNPIIKQIKTKFSIHDKLRKSNKEGGNQIDETHEPKSDRSKDFWIAQKIGETIWGKFWYVTRTKTSENGTVYLMKHQVPREKLMSFVKTGQGQRPDSRLIWKTPSGQWKTFNPETKEWDIAITNPSESVTNEMSGTGAVGAVSAPTVFQKKSLNEYDKENFSRVYPEGQFILKGGVDRTQAYELAKMFWYIRGGQQDKSGVWHFTTSSGHRPAIPCCRVGFVGKSVAIVNRLPNDKEEVLVGNAILRDLGIEAAPFDMTIREAVGGNSSDPTKEEMVQYLEAVYAQLLDRRTFEEFSEPAIYWFANRYHGGQTSNLYSVLSTSPYRPGRIATGPEKDSVEDDMYQTLVLRFGGGSEPVMERISEGDEADAVNAMWDGSDDELKQYRKPRVRKVNTNTKKPNRKFARIMVKGKEVKPSEINESFKRIQKIYKDRQGGVDVYWIDNKDTGGKTHIKPENINQYLRQGAEIVDLQNADQVNEMTTTGDVSGYNVPSAFARKGGSAKGVAGSAALGYTLTPDGEKEMQRQGDRLLEDKNDGQPICKKCHKPLHYAGQIECHKCGTVQ